VKFIVDAQLPRALAVALTAVGHQAIHTLDLPAKNLSSDTVITRLADAEGRIVMSKDADFVTSHIAAAFESVAYVELTTSTIISHG
jgi:predicted nuclease of predicted toxin-antitoxin system